MLACATLLLPLRAHAACPIELSVYRDAAGVAGIDFRPAEGATATNAFRMHFDKGALLDGMVLWSEVAPHPFGLVTFGCPEGDATQDELNACTVWQGGIYAVDETGKVGPLPRAGQPAPKTLVFSDFAFNVATADALANNRPDPLPGDVFELSGCQE